MHNQCNQQIKCSLDLSEDDITKVHDHIHKITREQGMNVLHEQVYTKEQLKELLKDL